MVSLNVIVIRTTTIRNWNTATKKYYYYYNQQAFLSLFDTHFSYHHHQNNINQQTRNVVTKTTTKIITQKSIPKTIVTRRKLDRRMMTTTKAERNKVTFGGDDHEKQQQQQPQKQPLIVLAGWLGCHPKSLRRFEELYIDICCRNDDDDNMNGTSTTTNTNIHRPTILTPIASPAMIVNTIMGYPSRNNAAITTTTSSKELLNNPYQLLLPPPGWPSSTIQVEGVTKNYKGSLEAYAWDVLQDIYNNSIRESNDNCPYIIIHPFSNGGYFLWEMIRRILVTYGNPAEDETNDNNNNNVSKILYTIRTKIRGIVLDSCPAMDIDKLSQAMAYISWEEQLDVLRYCGWEYISFPYIPQWKQRVTYNATNYFEPLYKMNNNNNSLSSMWQIPHLFLYSSDDPLTNAIHINNVMEQRQQQPILQNLTYYQRWDKSSHCGHLKNHPIEYRNEIVNFLQLIQQQQQQQNNDDQQKESVLSGIEPMNKKKPMIESKL